MTREVEKKSFTELETEKDHLIQEHKLFKDHDFKHHSGFKATIKDIVFDCKTNRPLVIYDFYMNNDLYSYHLSVQRFARPVDEFVESFKPAGNYDFFTTVEERDKIRRFLKGEIS